MKRTTAITLFLIVAVIALLAYKWWRSRQSTTPPGPQTTASQCDQNLWQFVYHPNRLQVLNPCTSVTGAVDEVRQEPDGDFHIRFHLDLQYISLLNLKNISSQQGDLVLEPICQHQVMQADAVAPCKPYAGPYFQPQVGQRYLVWGAYVNDAEHGWNELHPITSLQPIP